MQKAIVAFVASLAVLGLLGGCLVVAGAGFMTGSKRGGWKTFVPVPEAYIMAGIMFVLSGIAVLWLLQRTRFSPAIYLACAAAYIGIAAITTHWLNSAFL